MVSVIILLLIIKGCRKVVCGYRLWLVRDLRIWLNWGLFFFGLVLYIYLLFLIRVVYGFKVLWGEGVEWL